MTLFLVFFNSNAKAQCTNCNSNYPGGTFSTTSAAWSTVGTAIYGGEYAFYNVSAGSTYVWTTCGLTSYDTQLTLRQGSNCYGTYIAYSDDACGVQSQITWTATFTGTVTVLLSQYNCSNNTTNTRIDWRCSNYVPPAPSYCTPYTNYTCCMGISQVIFNTINNSSGNTNYTYQNFTNLSTNVEAGSTTNLFIAGWSYEQYATVWVDLNNNFTFEPSERLATGVYMGYNCNIAITIPAGTSLGNHRMRIRTQYYWDGVQYDPCATTNYGETEDYTINVTAPCIPPSDPGFGNNTWNVIGYSHGGYNYGNMSAMAGHTLRGYYTNSTIDINSQNQWCNTCSPSDASGWTGCSLGIDNHTVVYKRQGFPTAFYQIDLNSHDDGVQCYVNGSLVYQTDGCCADRGVIWSGVLCSTSTVEFRVMEGGGGSHLLVDFIDSPFTAGTINGTPTVCPGSTSNFTSNGNTGGTWSSSNTNVASVNSSTGLVTAVNTGSATITYTISNAQCGNVSTTYAVSVPAAASSGTISGNTSLCLGNTSQLSSNGTSGGTWSSSNTGVATVSSSGLVTSVAAGSSTITYTVSGTNGCPNASSTVNATVNAIPTANAGADVAICAGQTTLLSGTGSSSDTYTYTISMSDTYGDGWNGGYLSAYINGSWVGNYAASGYGSNATLNVISGQTIYFTYTGGSWESENYYTINLNGVGVHSAGTYPPTGTVYTNNSHPSTYVYTWSPTTALSSTSILSPSCSASSNTTYTLTVSKNGCSATDQVVVSMRTLPVPPTYSANPTTLCLGNTTSLSVNGLAPSGQAFEGNGSNSYIKVYQDIPEYNFTIEMWMKTSAANTGIFGVYEDGGGHDRHLYLNGGQLWARVWQGNGWNTGVTLNDGQWHHIALTVQTGVGQKVYVDGNQVATYGYDHSDFNWQTSFHIGYSNDMGYFNGLIDNVRIWNVVRSQSELANNMYLNAPSGSGLVANYLLEGNANATTAGNNGNAYNNTWANANYITYTWAGTGAPSASLNITQTSNVLNASTSYSVSASAGGCLGTSSPSIPITVNGVSTATTPLNTDMVWRGSTSSDYATVANWLQYNGTSLVASTVAPSTSTNVIIPGNQTCVLNQPSLGSNTVNAKNVTIEPSSVLSLNSGTLNMKGNFTNNGTLNAGTGTVAFTGTTTQLIGGSNPTEFYNLTVNNNHSGAYPSHVAVKLEQDATITNTLTLTDGILDVFNKVLTLGTPTTKATVSPALGSVDSYVAAHHNTLPVNHVGFVKQFVHSANVGNNTFYNFPIGDDGKWTPFNLRFDAGTSIATGAFITTHVNDALVSGASNSNFVSRIVRDWEVEPSAGITSPNYTIEIFHNQAATETGGLASSGSVPFKKTSGTNQLNAPTNALGINSSAIVEIGTYTSTGNSFTWTGLTSFSNFGGTDVNQALPIELVSFQANCKEDNTVSVTWTTASEHNTSHYAVEKSRDGINWSLLGQTAAAGNSTQLLTYEMIDSEKASGTTYYRLTQFDNDGVFEVFNPVSVNCNGATSNNHITTYPNPSLDGFYVSLFTETMEGNGQLTITDASGRKVYAKSVSIQNGNNVFHIGDLNAAPGMYYIQVSNGTTTTHIVKHSLR